MVDKLLININNLIYTMCYTCFFISLHFWGSVLFPRYTSAFLSVNFHCTCFCTLICIRFQHFPLKNCFKSEYHFNFLKLEIHIKFMKIKKKHRKIRRRKNTTFPTHTPTLKNQKNRKLHTLKTIRVASLLLLVKNSPLGSSFYCDQWNR